MTSVLVNGLRDDAVSTSDRGFTLGDGVFETIAVRAGQPRLWATHMARLDCACRRLDLPAPDPATLFAEALQVIDGQPSGSLRITWTRGAGARGYALPVPSRPTRVVAFTPQAPPAGSLEPIAVRTCALRLARQPALGGIKHLNRLEQILARAEWSDPAIAEGLLYDSAGCLIEATACNVFLVTEDRLLTPDLTEAGVSGIMRSAVIAASEAAGLECEVLRLYAEDLQAADEVFLAGSAWGIRPVASIDGHARPAPGPTTRLLAGMLDTQETVPYREN